MKVCSLIGGPGVGKGTFAKIICSRLNLQHISLGELMRDASNAGTAPEEVKQLLKSGSLLPDKVAHGLVMKEMELARRNNKGILLDGYPRTLIQAVLLDSSLPMDSHSTQNQLTASSETYATGSNNTTEWGITVVNVTLEKSAVIAKLLGRRICNTCGRGFNTASVMYGEFDMPAILPDPSTCPLGVTGCRPDLILRDDDTEEIIAKRILEHEQSIQPILEFYHAKQQLRTFSVKKGIKDVDHLIEVIAS